MTGKVKEARSRKCSPTPQEMSLSSSHQSKQRQKRLFTVHCEGMEERNESYPDNSSVRNSNSTVHHSSDRTVNDLVGEVYFHPGQAGPLGGHLHSLWAQGLDRAAPSTCFLLSFSAAARERGSGGFLLGVVSLCSNIKIFGTGTKLIVTDKAPEQPAIRLFPPNITELENNGRAQVVCLLTDFFPEVIRVSWEIPGENIGKVFTGSVKEDPNGKYSTISRLEVTQVQWGGKDITCRVEHETGSASATINSKTAVDTATSPSPPCPTVPSATAENVDEGPPLDSLQIANFTYTLLLVKSVAYCGIISFILYKAEHRDMKKPL
ncbi:M1-specific T cell receptor beta chain-like [Scyliorhinus canicula]|uniref:M1-specific T cell receptor beta chain-like n=1 Tax=Scyliorhinus canicula TaxID=7830 RepID=UPI0018F2970C|nr:M1-specific T cell receptor beta chain-like [Scyliorhinus canicula]